MFDGKRLYSGNIANYVNTAACPQPKVVPGIVIVLLVILDT